MPEAVSTTNFDTDSFPQLKNDLYLRAARGEATERAPVWCMRQAGRYLPEFRAIRVENEFFNVCRTPVQPLRRYAGLLDAAIIFSDILVIPQAMGMEVQMVPGKGPHFPSPLRSPADMADFSVDRSLDYVYKAITNTRHALQGQCPLLGFVGAPWTLMAYMVEGGGSKTFALAKSFLLQHRESAHELLGRLADVAARFLVGQVRAGAQALQVFESWAGELGPQDFDEFSLPYLEADCLRMARTYAIEALAAETLFDVISLDWTRSGGGRSVVLQGNLDPTVLFAEPERCAASLAPPATIANLGHGMMPTHDPNHLQVFLEAVHESSQALRN
ncbi:uroporphyrinogen decarboxylase [Linderina pennispora]|uniref:Uroporphyrinogen decarboxylase n=1 Tax=Linderina pennispora TaxID=61395 RepID=A0A1Y1W407_9FUNG|nr:uroporphyrinogen decarboxylase [Linderina pennispora]ORX68188.1 uroporphyrinogen decarboxylase [Linderina pennispora]